MPRKKKATKGAVEAPTSSCLLICDDVLVSQGHNKHILNGVVGQIIVPKTPTALGPFVAYIRLSNVYGGQEIKLCFSSAGEEEEEVFSVVAKSPAQSDPLQTHTIILRIPQFEINEIGRYIFSATHGGVPFAQCPIEIEALDSNPDEEEQR